MKIRIFGPGCMKCRETEKIVRNVLAEAGIEADVEKVEDIQAIVAAGVVSTPAVEIDGQVKIAGKVPRPDDIKRLIGA
ncbi:MAG: redox-active disulfide protein 2 [Armatimonadota bacterium]|nr:MAG: redox-active disulfide protein 2 [Armatimonadota bacterium]